MLQCWIGYTGDKICVGNERVHIDARSDSLYSGEDKLPEHPSCQLKESI